MNPLLHSNQSVPLRFSSATLSFIISVGSRYYRPLPWESLTESIISIVHLVDVDDVHVIELCLLSQLEVATLSLYPEVSLFYTS